MLKIGKDLTISNVLKKVDSYSIFKHYCPGFTKVNECFSSEFRKDSNPSCFIINHKGDLLYVDFGEPPNEYSNKGSYRALDYVARKYGISKYDAAKKINQDFSLGLGCGVVNSVPKYNIIKNSSQYIPPEKKETIIRIKARSFSKIDLDYWSSYGWTLEMLQRANIKPITHYWIDNEKNNNQIFRVGNKLVYSMDYYENNGIFRRKIYLPFNSLKWISNVDDTIVQGWDMLPKEGGNYLFITKGFKDIGPFIRLGYNAIAPNNEKSFIPEKVFFDKIVPRWKTVIIWYDNDDTGKTCSKQFSDKYGLYNFCNPDKTSKDPSDFVKDFGLDRFDKLVKNLLCKTNVGI